MKYTIIADPNVKHDLKEAKDYLNGKRKDYGNVFLKQYKEADFWNRTSNIYPEFLL